MSIESCLNTNLSSEEYHSFPNSFSSSQLKDALEDLELFHRKYIAKTEERVSIPAFDIGTYFHTAILEPHKLQVECAVFKGIRRGKAWDDFKELNKDKAIITSGELEQANGLIEAVKKSPIAMMKVQQGEAEVSGFLKVIVGERDIYCLDREGDYFILTDEGFRQVKKPNCSDPVGMVLKVRADCLGPDFILDLKSTTGNVKLEHQIKSSVSKYNYDLSAALYLDIFSVLLNKDLKHFIWTFASKDHFNCKNYLASETNIKIGRAKWKKAVLNIRSGILNNWEFVDELSILEPNFYELEHLRKQGEELL